ncbi:MAG: hypothetical protein HN904_00325 [Victivallales bacterium]|jgi:acetylglutamate kinase|nr:hypothetical protein [Victivallales bacterium]
MGALPSSPTGFPPNYTVYDYAVLHGLPTHRPWRPALVCGEIQPVPDLLGYLVVIKLSGGHINQVQLWQVAMDVTEMKRLGALVIVVHGAGDALTDAFQTGLDDYIPKTRRGQRVTTPEMIPILKRVLADENAKIVRDFAVLGLAAIGMADLPEDMFQARRDRRQPDNLGLVGCDVKFQNNAAVLAALEQGRTPVLGGIGFDEGGVEVNVNADSVAGAVACCMPANSLQIISDTPGFQRYMHDPGSTMPIIRTFDVGYLKDDGVIGQRAAPKVDALARAARLRLVARTYPLCDPALQRVRGYGSILAENTGAGPAGSQLWDAPSTFDGLLPFLKDPDHPFPTTIAVAGEYFPHPSTGRAQRDVT